MVSTESRNFLVLIFSSIALALVLSFLGFTALQVTATTVFFSAVMGTILFWKFRLAIIAAGIAILLGTNTINIETMIQFMSADVILFLIGMMTLVALLRRVGFFESVMIGMVNWTNWDPKKLMIVFALVAALSSALVDEVTAILLVAAVVLDICDHLNIEPTRYIIVSVLAANIGSSATVFGNPIGILIALRAGLTFEEFIRWATPISIATLLVLIPVVIVYYRKSLAADTAIVQMKLKRGVPAYLRPSHMIPDKKRFYLTLAIFLATLGGIVMHGRIEEALHLEKNSMLLGASLLAASAVLIVERRDAQKLIEREVDWWNITFFMLLFTSAGALRFTGVTDVLAKAIFSASGGQEITIMTFILFFSAILSGFIDNTPLVAAFIPIVQSFGTIGGVNIYPLWWAMLFGGTLGGNLTIIGSTANIVALGVLEKRKGTLVSFIAWLKIGFITFVVTTFVAWVLLYLQMPLLTAPR